MVIGIPPRPRSVLDPPLPPVAPSSRSPWLGVSRASAPGWFLAGLTLGGLGIGALVLGWLPSSDPALMPSLLMTPLR